MPDKKLLWITNAISKDLYAPFEVEKDSDYYLDLRDKYNLLLKNAKKAKADTESIGIINKYKKRILESLRAYYAGDIIAAHKKIRNLVKECVDDKFAVSAVNNSFAFPGLGPEVQFFRARLGNPRGFKAKEMLHLPYSLRGKTGNYRFSIPGVPSLYLGNSSYACWIELGRPAEVEFNVSPVLLEGDQRIFNLAVMNRDFHGLNDGEADRVHTWLRLMMLMIATSYRVKEPNRTFKSEYIVSQSVMLACKKLGLDGIAYYSRRVTDQVFALAAVNVALFTEYKFGKEYSEMCNHVMIGDSFNYQTFKQLGPANTDAAYELRTAQAGSGTVIGSYDRKYSYGMTDFCQFDKFLFKGWNRDKITWGNALND